MAADATKLFAFDIEGWHDGGAAPNKNLARLDGAAGPLLKVHLIEQWLLKKALPFWAAGKLSRSNAHLLGNRLVQGEMLRTLCLLLHCAQACPP